LLCHESGAYHAAIPPFSALTLWQHDNSLTIALEVCKAFLEPIEYLTSLYPGPGAWPRVSAVFLHSYTQLVRSTRSSSPTSSSRRPPRAHSASTFYRGSHRRLCPNSCRNAMILFLYYLVCLLLCVYYLCVCTSICSHVAEH
jgi:hypothetical protein